MLRSPSYERSDDDLDLDFFDDSRGKITDTGISAHLKIASEGDLDGHSTYKVSLATGKQLVLMRDPMAGTGGLLWPAGEVLANYLTSISRGEPGLFRDKKVLELGSGTGVVGLSIAMQVDLGHGAVFLTDLQKVLPVLRRNVALNDNVKSVHVRLLEWGTAVASDLRDCDIILMADCVYLEALFEPLIDSLLQVMQKQSARAYLCYKKRRKADSRFFKLLRKQFDLKQLSLAGGSIEQSGVYLYELSRT